MIIDTKYLGEVEINDGDTIYFEEGLLGLENISRYTLLNMDGTGTLKCLQSLDEKNIAFILINPWDVYKDYDIDIDDNEIMSFEDRDINNFVVFSLVTVTQDKMTANLLGPVIINVKTRQGKQIVLYNSSYSTKHLLKSFVKASD